MKSNKTKLNSNKKGNLASVKCKKCRKEFAINKNFIGVITCPYCGNHVEG